MNESSDARSTTPLAENEGATPARNGELPESISRYAILRQLGRGGFGVVYLAHDTQLDRLVAIKVPHPHLLVQLGDVKLYLEEARSAASLDHPNVVPVLDVGSTDRFPCFVVSKYVDGDNLANRVKDSPLSIPDAARLIASVGEALHHAHAKGLVHRDVKPSNILVDKSGKPYLTDFGIALREQDYGRHPGFVGTPEYASPEQARGEGHRVDGRSDVFSLGVVFYELLTNRRPFRADDKAELLEQIVSKDVRPPRQWNDAIPRELERICLKALEKRASERYTTAKDMSDDLRHFLARHGAGEASSDVAKDGTPQLPTTAQATPPMSRSELPIQVMPRGLRSFGAADAQYFLELLPGPRDREGLPATLRFWKTHLEQLEADQTFPVGLMYGPSGCGKSSLVLAGLLPRLAKHVVPIYVEATAEGTEARLLGGIQKCCGDAVRQLRLADAVAHVRQRRALASGKKILFVIDQFEQWLHARRADAQAELVQALRQCDGARVQALVMVRDDFWMAATRFMHALEIRMVEGGNSAAVDLFDLRHAQKVLTALGRAYGALPNAELTPSQREFLAQAVVSLANDDKIIPVRLSLFAEMVKGKAWSPATLRLLGGARGIGVAFLEETFAAPNAPPEHRFHLKAAQAVLAALLPESGTTIKGHQRSWSELLAISGYQQRPEEFADLMRILDGEVRLVTPTDLTTANEQASPHSTNERSFQLAHDYLVQPLRDWLTRKQRETWQGRARLLLEERAASWEPTRQARLLPSLPEFLYLWTGTLSGGRTAIQRLLLRAAATRHLLVWGGLFALLLGAAIALERYVATERRRSDENLARVRVEQVLDAPPAELSGAIRDLLPLAALARPHLRQAFDGAATSPLQKLHAACALAQLGEVEDDFLLASIPRIPPPEVDGLLTALRLAPDQVLPRLELRVHAETNPEERARYAIVALQLGGAACARQVLAPSADPVYRTTFIHSFADWHGDLRGLAGLLRTQDDACFRSGMSAALGKVPADALGNETKLDLAAVLREWHRDAPDGGTHSASGWALRQWGLPPEAPAPRTIAKDAGWFVNGQGVTMIMAPPGSFTFAWKHAKEVQREHVDVSKPFYLSEVEISVDLVSRFTEDAENRANKQAADWRERRDKAGLKPDAPATLLTWVEAVEFCNWLSAKDGRQQCYSLIPDASGREQNPSSWQCDFTANGYRLPRAWEWEYASLAGAATKYCFGDDPKYLRDYAWYVVNSEAKPWPCGRKMPNAWGFFDMRGNVDEWCWEENLSGAPPSTEHRLVRGGHGFSLTPLELSSAGLVPPTFSTGRSALIGFRVACSAPPH